MSNSNPTFKDRALQVVAIIGLIAILLLGAWGIIQLAFVLWGFVGNIGANSPATTQVQAEKLNVTLPVSVDSGSPFTVSFNRTNGTGTVAYEVSYSCADGVTMQAPLPAGKMQSVPCNTPFNYTGATQAMQLTATNTGTTAAAVTITVAARDLGNNAIHSSGTGIITVSAGKNASKPAATSTAKPASSSTSRYVASNRTSRLFGQADLAVSINSVSQTGVGRYNVTFTVQNVGTNVAPAGWTFNASLPTPTAYNYASQTQQALYPGDKIVYTLGFSMQNNYGYTTYDNNYTYSYPSSYQYQYTYSNCGYTNNYTYNGAYTYPGTSYTCPAGSTVYNYPTYIGYQAPTNYYQSYNNYGYSNGTINITVDPSNFLYESNESNNTATASI